MPMHRDIAELAAGAYDLVIIGGGAYGACAAWEAALRGLKTALLERGDFGAATSANSLHTIHGGLRYLQHLDLRRMRESIRERRQWMCLAPEVIEPMRFVLPTFGHGLRGPEIMAAALALNDLIGADRNRGLRAARRLPPGGLLSHQEASAAFGKLSLRSFNGAAVWYDGFNSSPERLMVALLQAARSAGAQLANYVTVDGFLHRGATIHGVTATDTLSGGRLELRARCVLNSAGPWVDAILDRLDSPLRRAERRLFLPSRAFNLVVPRLPLDAAVGIPVPRQGRAADAVLDKGTVTYFIIPWGDYSLIGTKHLPCAVGADEWRVGWAEVCAFLEEINPWLGPWQLQPRDVIAIKAGLLPAQAGDAGAEVALQRHARIVDHAREGLGGLITLFGVKWTTARLVAQRAVELACRKLGHTPTLAARRLRVRSGEDPRGEMPDRALEGSRAGASGRLVEDLPVSMTDIETAARDEMAVKLCDAVLRRTPLGLSTRLDGAVIARCAETMQRELNWTAAQTEHEVGALREALRRRDAWREDAAPSSRATSVAVHAAESS
jgi:glycerol-3-phosphate dehydrogenase